VLGQAGGLGQAGMLGQAGGPSQACELGQAGQQAGKKGDPGQ
jgi:hypothetical protein